MDRTGLILVLCLVLGIVNCGEIKHIPVPDENLEEKLSGKCAQDIRVLNENLKNLTTWAVQMWDASAKEEIALISGSNYQLGNYDECLPSIDNEFKGIDRQYCLAKLNLYPSNDKRLERLRNSVDFNHAVDIINREGNSGRMKRNEIYWAICAPASCSNKDLTIILKDYHYFSTLSNRYNLNYTVSIDQNMCQLNREDEPFSSGSIAFICVTIVLLMLILISTGFHWFAEYRETDSDKKSASPEYVKAFSALHNLSQLTVKGEPSLRLVYGIRAFSILFIICGHLYGTIASGPVENRNYLEAFYSKKIILFSLQQLETYVDTFFVLSGFFAMHFLLKYAEKNRFNCAKILIGRYVRLMPLYAYIMFFTATILPQSGSGPFWNIMKEESDSCRKNWWTNIFIVNNYVNVENLCMIHSWFMACDFHFYIITTFLCYFMVKPSRIRIILIFIGGLLGLSMLIPFLVTFFMNLTPVLFINYEFLKTIRTHSVYVNIYIPSHSRMSPYIIGLFTGYIYHKYYKPANPKISMVKSVSGCISALLVFTIVSVILVNCFDADMENDPFDSALYAALYRPVKSLCTSALLLLCIFGTVPLIPSFLGWTPMIVLGKLTYATYLIHMELILRGSAESKLPVYVGFSSILHSTISYAIVSFTGGLIGYLMVEAPIYNVFKIAMTPKKRKPNRSDLENGHTNNGMEISERT